MGQERFEMLDCLYRAALKVEPGERSAFLDEACQGDESLRKEVQTLFDSDQGGVPSPTSSDTDTQTKMVRRGHTSATSRWFATSQIIADRFEIVTFLGQGGMGDVYEAKDLHLGEHVALKTIRPEYASDERMIAHFKQEILLAKKVTHPNVCRIYDVGFHIDPASNDTKMFRRWNYCGARRCRRGSGQDQ